MRLKKAIALSQIVWMIFFNVGNLGVALADDSDIFGNNIAPKHKMLFMFIDRSCSTECDW